MHDLSDHSVRRNSNQLLALCKDRFAHAIVESAATAGVRITGALETLSHEAGTAFDQLAGLKNTADFERLRSLTASRISLVHPEDMDLTVELINLAQTLNDACEAELPRLHLLFMSLLGQESSVLGQLPLGPTAVTQALRGMCDGGDVPAELRLKLPRQIEPVLIAALKKLYRELTDILESHGVEPKSLLRPKDNTPQHYFQKVGTLTSAQARMAGGRGDGNANSIPGSNPDSSAQPNPIIDTPMPEGALGRLQGAFLRRHVGMAGGTQVGQQLTDPGLLEAIRDRVVAWMTDRQRKGASLEGNQPQPRLNLTELTALLPPVSNAALEAVQSCCEALLADPSLHPSVKISMERLRIPVSKAVLLEPAVLTEAQHPVRAFLAVLLRLASTLSLLPANAADNGDKDDKNESAPSDQAVLNMIERIAQRIQTEFGRDMEVFNEASEALHALEQARLSSAEDHAKRLAPLLDREQGRERSRCRAARAVQALCVGEVPSPVQVFLEQLWLRVLAVVHQRHGEKSEQWLAVLNTANKLIVSVQPKLDAQDRQDLTTGLPGLLEELRRGLEAIGTPAALRDHALHSLAPCHAAALRGKTLDSGNTRGTPQQGPRIETMRDHPGLQLLRLAPEAQPERGLPRWLMELKAKDWIQLKLPNHGHIRLNVGHAEGSPKMVLLTHPSHPVAFISPLRWLATPDLHAGPVPMTDHFEEAAEAAIRDTHSYH